MFFDTIHIDKVAIVDSIENITYIQGLVLGTTEYNSAKKQLSFLQLLSS